MSEFRLCLKSVVLGCRDDRVYDILSTSLGLNCDTSNGDDDSLGIGNAHSSADPRVETASKRHPVFVKNYAQNKQSGKRLCLQYGHCLSRESALGFGLTNTDDAVLKNIVIISTSPFSYGKSKAISDHSFFTTP